MGSTLLEPHAALPRMFHHMCGDSIAVDGGVEHARPQVEPRRLGEHLSHEGIARLGDAPCAHLRPRGVLGCEKPHVGLEGARVREPGEVADLYGYRKRRVGGYALHAGEPGHHGGPALAAGLLLDHPLRPVPAVGRGKHIGEQLIEHRLVEARVELEVPQPVLIGSRPRLLALLVGMTLPQQEVGEPKFRGSEGGSGVLAHPHEVLGGLLLRIGNGDGGDVAGGEHPRQQHGIAAIVLHAIARGAEHLESGSDEAFEPRGVQRSGEREARGTALIDGAHRALEPRCPVDDVLRDGLGERRLRYLPREMIQGACGYGVGVDIETDAGTIWHESLLVTCGGTLLASIFSFRSTHSSSRGLFCALALISSNK